MNVKINEVLHNQLCEFEYKEYLFGSQLHGIASESSDYDYVRVISDDFYSLFKTKGKYLPNIHSFQHTVNKDLQIIWMTESQFYRGLFSGDGNMLADIVLLNKTHPDYEEAVNLCRCYRVIKGYLGVAKRDLKLYNNNPKKVFHAQRSLYMAQCLIDNKRPDIEGIIELFKMKRPLYSYLKHVEGVLRDKINLMLIEGKLDLFPSFKEDNELVDIIVKSNNIREFKYENSSNGGV